MRRHTVMKPRSTDLALASDPPGVVRRWGAGSAPGSRAVDAPTWEPEEGRMTMLESTQLLAELESTVAANLDRLDPLLAEPLGVEGPRRPLEVGVRQEGLHAPRLPPARSAKRRPAQCCLTMGCR